MTDIVQIQPVRRPTLGHFAALAVCLAVPLAPLAFIEQAPRTISHAEERAALLDTYPDTNGYPDIREARVVQVVGINCGPGGKELLVRESEEFPVSYILDNCQNIEVR